MSSAETRMLFGGSSLLSSPLIKLQSQTAIPYTWEASPAAQGPKWFVLAYVLRDDSIPSVLERGQQLVNQQVLIKQPRVDCPLEAWSSCSFCAFL